MLFLMLLLTLMVLLPHAGICLLLNRGLRRSSRRSGSSRYSLEEKSDSVNEKHIAADSAPAVDSVVKKGDPLLNNQVIEKKLLGTQACISVVGTASTSDLDKAATSEDIVQVATSTSDNGIVIVHSVESLEKENVERELGVLDEKTRVSAILVDRAAASEDIVQVATSTSDNDIVTVHFVESSEKENVERELGVLNEKTRVSAILVDKAAASEYIVQVATSASDNDIVTLHSIESSEKENLERELGVLDEKTRVSAILVDAGLDKRDNEASAVLHNDVVATSDAKPSATVNNEDKLVPFYDAPAVDASVHADDMKGSPHDHQLPVALLPRPVQPTSWKSCCGLFELLAGSNK